MKKAIFSLLVMLLFVISLTAQWPNKGKLNAWTLSTVSRTASSQDSVYLKQVRVARNKGYDRLVFEFTGGLPRYQIEYVKSGKFDTTGENVVTVGGRHFLNINLQSLPYPDDANAADAAIPNGDQRLTVFNEIKQVEWFEGVRDFGIGLNARRSYRVQQLTKPFRLVVDFKH